MGRTSCRSHLKRMPVMTAVLDFLRENPGSTRAQISAGIGVEIHQGILRRLHDEGHIEKAGRAHGNTSYWKVSR